MTLSEDLQHSKLRPKAFWRTLEVKSIHRRRRLLGQPLPQPVRHTIANRDLVLNGLMAESGVCLSEACTPPPANPTEPARKLY